MVQIYFEEAFHSKEKTLNKNHEATHKTAELC